MISPSQQIVSEGDKNNCIVVLTGKPQGQKKGSEVQELERQIKET